MFNYVLETYGLKLDQDGQPRTTYSLRHYALQTRLRAFPAHLESLGDSHGCDFVIPS